MNQLVKCFLAYSKLGALRDFCALGDFCALCDFGTFHKVLVDDRQNGPGAKIRTTVASLLGWRLPGRTLDVWAKIYYPADFSK